MQFLVCKKKRIFKNNNINNLGSAGNGEKTTYLCPTLGNTNAQLHRVRCPSSLQDPFGKQLQISYIGFVPFIKHDPFGGSDYKVVSIMADKIGFTPHFVPERAFDPITVNGSTYGMLYRVRF